MEEVYKVDEYLAVCNESSIICNVPEYKEYLDTLTTMIMDTIPFKIDNTIIIIHLKPGPKLCTSLDTHPDFSVNIYFHLAELYEFTVVAKSTSFCTTIHESYELLTSRGMEGFKTIVGLDLRDCLLKLIPAAKMTRPIVG